MNEIINANRKNKFAAAGDKRKIQADIMGDIRKAVDAGTLHSITEPNDVFIEFVEKNHKRDVDNIQSSQKFILDAMVKSGVLPDDSPKYVKQVFHIVSYGDEYEVKVYLRPCDENVKTAFYDYIGT